MKKILLSSLATAIGMAISSGVMADPKLTTEKKNKDVIVVKTDPLNRSSLLMTTPTKVLSGEELTQQRKASIAETLEEIPGISGSHFGAGAIKPIIRGMSGARVKVLNDGIDVLDASIAGPDHAITSEPFLANRIEVLKGPATLLYGGGAIGGVINVLDDRIPTSVPEKGYAGQIDLRTNSVANENTGAVGLTLGKENFALRLEGLKRHAQDYRMPKRAGELDSYRLQGSYNRTNNFNIGASLIGEKGYFGLAYGIQHNEYGLPGHSHAHCHEHSSSGNWHCEKDDHMHHHGHTHHGHTHAHNHQHHHSHGVPFVDMKQQRWEIRGEYADPFSGFERIRLRAAHTDYSHDEIEGQTVETTFNNKATEGRLELTHAPILGWRGVMGGQFTQRNFSAEGLEAYVPATLTRNQALFLIEEFEAGPLRYELGVRHEWQKIDVTKGSRSSQHSGTSGSAGVTWTLAPEYALTASLSHSKRLPIAEELYANGIHAATRTIETGYEHLKAESATNLDIGFTKFAGDFQFGLNTYYNHIDGYIYGQDAGYSPGAGYRHLHYVQQDAVFNGVEAEASYQLTDNTKFSVQGDIVKAKLRSGGYLPRIPAYRVSATIEHQWFESLTGRLRLTHIGSQHKTAQYETSTAGYNRVDIGLTWQNHFNDLDYMLYGRIENLFNGAARDHTSYIKNEMYLPGRNFVIGASLSF